MRNLLLAIMAFPALLCAQTTLDLGHQSKNVDFSASALTKPIRSVSSLPGSCTLYEMVFLTSATAGQNLYACTSVNVWTLQAGGGGGGGTGPTGPAGQGFNFRGAWTGFTAYTAFDVVTNGGNTYEADHSFTTTGSFVAGNWNLWASTGATGPAGPGLPITVLDSSYVSIAVACSAATPSGVVMLTQANTSVPTQTMNCGLQALGGSIQPASGALIRHDGRIVNSDTKKIWDMNAGGHVDYSQNKLIGYVTQFEFGALCDGATNDTTALNEMYRSVIVNQAAAGKALVGVRRVGSGTCMASNIFVTLNTFPTNCYTVGDCYAPSFDEGSASGQAVGGSLEYKAIAASAGYLYNAKSIDHTAITNLSLNGNATENCLIVDWPTAGPSLVNTFSGIHCANYTTKAISVQHQNDSTFEKILIDGTSGGSTAYAFYLEADGGACYSLSRINANIGKVFVDCQNGVIQDSYIRGGLEIGFDSGNSWTINGGQIEAAADTHAVINATATIHNLTCHGCYLAPSGLGATGMIFTGGFFNGAVIEGGDINIGNSGGTLFSFITTPASGNNPTFFFHTTWFWVYPGIPAAPAGTSGTWIVYDSCNDHRTGIMIPYTSTRTIPIKSVSFASLGTPADGTIFYCPDCTAANPVAGSGTGVLARRENGVWNGGGAGGAAGPLTRSKDIPLSASNNSTGANTILGGTSGTGLTGAAIIGYTPRIDFLNTGTPTIQWASRIPPEWNSAATSGLTIALYDGYFTGGNVGFVITSQCVAVGSTAPTFPFSHSNSALVAVGNGTTADLIIPLTMTGCTAGQLWLFSIQRDNTVSGNLANPSIVLQLSFTYSSL